MAKKDKEIDWDKEEKESDIELYIRLYPYLLRDFYHKNDMRNILLNYFQTNQLEIFVDFDSINEGISKGLEYKSHLNSGDDLNNKIKPVIEL